MTGVLAGRVVVLVAPVSADETVSRALVGPLTDAGASVRVVGPVVDPDAATAVMAPGPDVVIVAPSVSPVAVAFSSLSDDEFEAICEGPIRSALLITQAAYPHLVGRDGRLVFICPTVSMEGAAGLVAYSAAAEAQRMLAKSAARRWGRDGITVNVVAPAVGDFAVDVGPDARRGIASLPETGLRGMSETVVWLASRSSSGVTGATIGVDGGALMSP